MCAPLCSGAQILRIARIRRLRQQPQFAAAASGQTSRDGNLRAVSLVRPAHHAAIAREWSALETFVRARLYTDGQGPQYREQQRYQQENFKTVALPLYAIVDADGRTIATFAGLTRDPGEFLQFLDAPR